MSYASTSTASIASNLLQIKATVTNTYGSISTTQNVVFPNINGPSFSQGSGAGKFSIVGFGGGTLASSTPVDLDLTTLEDGAGNTASSLTKVRGFLFLNFSTTAVITLGDATSNAWAALWGATGTHIVRPGRTNGSSVTEPGLVLAVCGDATGYAVSGTSKILKIDPGSATMDYFVAVLGE